MLQSTHLMQISPSFTYTHVCTIYHKYRLVYPPSQSSSRILPVPQMQGSFVLPICNHI